MNINTLLTDREKQQTDTVTVKTTLMTTIPVIKESVTEEVCLEVIYDYENEKMEEYTETETHDEWYFLFNQKKISFDDLDVLIAFLDEEYKQHSQLEIENPIITIDTESCKEEEFAIAPINENIYSLLIICQKEVGKPYLFLNNTKIYLSELKDEIKQQN